MFGIVQDLMKTRQELRKVKEQLHTVGYNWKLWFFSSFSFIQLQVNDTIPTPTIDLFVQYNGFFNQLCYIGKKMTVEELLVRDKIVFTHFLFLI
jgi:hypothetical protein